MFVEIKRRKGSNYVRISFGGRFVYAGRDVWAGMVGTAVQKAYRVWGMVERFGHSGGRIMWLDFVRVCEGGRVVVSVNGGGEVVI